MTFSTDYCVVWVVGSLPPPSLLLCDKMRLNSLDKSLLKFTLCCQQLPVVGGAGRREDQEKHD